MKDVANLKDGTNERTINKIQDFINDETLFEYCQDSEVCFKFLFVSICIIIRSFT